MYICWKCGQEYENDDLDYCRECGAVNPSTLPIAETEAKRDKYIHTLRARLKKAGIIDNSHYLVVEIGGEEILVSLEQRIVFGRDKGDLQDAQMVNLEYFQGHEAGVSRRHAAIQQNDDSQIVIIDLSSTNGTTLNGKLLEPLEEYPLQDGDEVCLGNLALVIHIDEL